jgi:hypothetical protein
MLARFWMGLSLLVCCLPSDAWSNDRDHRPRAGHRARPGVVWAITQSAEEGADEIVFEDLPQTAAHIQGIVGLRLDQASTGDQQVRVQMNGDGGLNYNTSAWRFASNGMSGVLPGCGIGVGQIVLGVVDSESQYTFTISDYSSEERKKDLSAHGWAVTGFFPGNVLSILSGGVHTGGYEPVESLRFYLSEPGGRLSSLSKITIYGLSDGTGTE